MGLDIQLVANNESEWMTPDYFDDKVLDAFHTHNLSRTFCNLMCKRYAVGGEPELEQIGRITGIDITSLYDMEKEWDEFSTEHQLSFAQTQEERNKVLEGVAQDKAKLQTNLDTVLTTINTLIEKTSAITNLPSLLDDNGFDSLDNASYFSDFEKDKGDGYIGNNFGQDLRNFRRYLEYAKSRGATGVHFLYG